MIVQHYKMSIRHRPKDPININQLVADLENPSPENLESLNQQLGKYLDKIEEPLNLSFWETVTFTYWSYVNLIKLADKTYDTSSEEFIKKIYAIANQNMRNSPKPQTPVEPEFQKETPSLSQQTWMLSYLRPKYIVGGVVALFVVGAAIKMVKDE